VTAATPWSHSSRSTCSLLILALVILWPGPAAAYRPFNGTDAAVAEKGMFELELGPLGYLSQTGERALLAPSLVLNWGVADGWEVVLEGRHFVHVGGDASEPRLRVEDTGLFLKGVIREGELQEKTGVSLATELGALLPTVNGEAGAGAEWALIASRRWASVTAHLTGAASYTRAHSLGLFGSTILEGPERWAVRPVGEVFVEEEGGGAATFSGLMGAIWRATDHLSFDGGVRLARTGGADTVELRAGVTWGFSVGFPR
jgi:hypothetical protein